MALVNLQAPSGGVPWIDHAPWNGLTAADLVFPFFLVAVGVSTACAMDGRSPVRWVSVLRRAALLFAIGVAVNWALHPRAELAELRLPGVLQRIALVYLACAIVAARSRTAWEPLLIALALLAAHAALLLSVAAPGEAAPSLAAGKGLSGWLDRTLVPLRLYQPGYDPEGVLSTLSAIASGLLGLAAGRAGSMGAATQRVALTSAGAVVLGMALTPWLPLNKALWTPSFALVTAGAGQLAWLMLGALARPSPRRLDAAAWLGRRALDFYMLHMLVLAALMLRLGGRRLWRGLYEPLAAVTGSPGWASMLFAGIVTCACLALLAAATRKGRLLRI